MQRCYYFCLALLLASLTCGTASAQLSSYSQDFEGLNMASSTALGDDGWLFFGNVFNPGGGYLYGYGPGPAPNGGPAFSAIATGQAGPNQGTQYLNIYSDYNNGDHNNGNLIEANVFQERTIAAGDVGQTYTFSFDAVLPDVGGIASPTTAVAFIKTLDPGNGFALTNFLTVDMTNVPSNWDAYSTSITIDGSLSGQILQFGFASTATNFNPSGVYYDNVNFSNVPEPSTMAMTGLAIMGFVAIRTRRAVA